MVVFLCVSKGLREVSGSTFGFPDVCVTNECAFFALRQFLFSFEDDRRTKLRDKKH